MGASWDEIRGKIKHAYDEIESAYQNHVVSAVDKVKERPLLNTAVKLSLSTIPIVGSNLRDLYDNIGGGTKSEEDKAKQILEFLSELEQKNQERFDRVAEILKTNQHQIIEALNENRISITDLISKSSAEILEKVRSIKEDTVEIRRILEKERAVFAELKHTLKPITFRGESNIFVGRKEYITKIKQYLMESSTPVSIVGEGGMGKSALAFKAIHEFEDMFDVIIPIYLESLLTFDSFLLEMAKRLQLPMAIDKFEQVDSIWEKTDIITDALAKHRRTLIYADNYETVSNSIIGINKNSITQSSKQEDAVRINNFLKGVRSNASVVLTSRQRHNLTKERILALEGLSVQEGYDLFIEVAGEKLPRKLQMEIRGIIEEISKKTGGHPLSIEILASTYEEDLLPELREMVKHLGARVVNLEQGEKSRHKSLEACFEYSLGKLPESHRLLLPELAFMFKSPFPASAVEHIFSDDAGESVKEATTAASIL